ncbi:DUF1977-domain-containing protein [Spatholobus suberectus]|nr:DUF1977-domain-containing protein [Spatholobus suberectus]
MRDLHGTRLFAIRARKSDSMYEASEHLLSVIDKLLADWLQINDHHHDWYEILQIHRYTINIDHIATQYRCLALLLDPHRNLLAFANHAFSFVHDAWSVLSNPAKRSPELRKEIKVRSKRDNRAEGERWSKQKN